MKFKWKWCPLCETAYVECPKCGNNCCNGGYGQIDGEPCDVCELAYQYQDLAWQCGVYPPKEELEEEVRRMTFEEWWAEVAEQVADSVPDSPAIRALARQAFEAAQAAEREACARIAEAHTSPYQDWGGVSATETALAIARAIRKRGE